MSSTDEDVEFFIKCTHLVYDVVTFFLRDGVECRSIKSVRIGCEHVGHNFLINAGSRIINNTRAVEREVTGTGIAIFETCQSAVANTPKV